MPIVKSVMSIIEMVEGARIVVVVMVESISIHTSLTLYSMAVMITTYTWALN